MLNIITYKQVSPTSVEVRLAGKLSGHITKMEATATTKAGWAYFPKGGAGLRGEIFASIGLVKASLEAE
jgi:hypothetical protein